MSLIKKKYLHEKSFRQYNIQIIINGKEERPRIK